MNITAIIIVAFLAIGLLVFMINKNLKDEKEYEHQQNIDYKKAKDVEGDIDAEETPH